MFRPCSLIRLQKNKLEKERVSHSKEFDGKRQGQAESMGTTPDAYVAMMLRHAIFVTGGFFHQRPRPGEVTVRAKLAS